MTKEYVKKYIEHHNIGEQDIILCKVCGKIAVDLHHIIMLSQCGSDNPENIIPLCRECHMRSHSNKITKQELYRLNKI